MGAVSAWARERRRPRVAHATRGIVDNQAALVGERRAGGVERGDDRKRSSGEARVEGGWPDRSDAGGDRAAHVAGDVVPRWQSADKLAGGDRAARVAEEVGPRRQ